MMILVEGGLNVLMFFLLLYFAFGRSKMSFYFFGAKKEITVRTNSNAFFYTPIMENALTLVVGVGIVVALIFLIVMVVDWISDGVNDIFNWFTS